MALAERIVRNTILQVLRLAHINRIALGIKHAIYTGLQGKPRDEISNEFGAGEGVHNLISPRIMD